MRIATWNTERLHRPVQKTEHQLSLIDADILVLTEADSRIDLKYPYVCRSAPLYEMNPSMYAVTEHRVIICSKKPFINKFETYNPYETVCVEVESQLGTIAVYGTVMGAFGNRNPLFLNDVHNQMNDIRQLVADGKRVCICGDFNLSFADNYYFTEKGRAAVMKTFDECKIYIATEKQNECIDHIALSEEITENCTVTVQEWNIEKKMSDHKGIFIDITPEI